MKKFTNRKVGKWLFTTKYEKTNSKSSFIDQKDKSGKLKTKKFAYKRKILHFWL